MGSKKKKKEKKKFHDNFLRSLSSNQRWPRVATLFDFPRLIFNSQAKANIRSIRRIGQQSRGSLLDYVHDPFRMEGEGTGMDEFLQGQQESVSCRTRELHEGNWREHRNYCRRRCNNIQPIVSGRVAGTRDTFCTAGSLMRESRDTREPNHDRDPLFFGGTARFYPTLSLRHNAGFDE